MVKVGLKVLKLFSIKGLGGVLELLKIEKMSYEFSSTTQKLLESFPGNLQKSTWWRVCIKTKYPVLLTNRVRVQ